MSDADREEVMAAFDLPEWLRELWRSHDLVSRQDIPLRNTAIKTYDMVLPTWPDDVVAWTPLRNRIPRASKCYRLGSGAMVHVKPGCRC